jgi:hypothetical protein
MPCHAGLDPASRKSGVHGLRVAARNDKLFMESRAATRQNRQSGAMDCFTAFAITMIFHAKKHMFVQADADAVDGSHCTKVQGRLVRWAAPGLLGCRFCAMTRKKLAATYLALPGRAA